MKLLIGMDSFIETARETYNQHLKLALLSHRLHMLKR